MNGIRVAASWSGGKDSCLALNRVIALGAKPVALVTVFDESGARSRSHGLRQEVLAAQADRLGVGLRVVQASWATYEAVFKQELRSLHEQDVVDMVFGDIDLVPHREWEERVCRESQMRAHLPLWQCERRRLLEEFWASGFRCHVVAVDGKRLPQDVLGSELTRELADSFASAGIDECGENGEFHTVVVDGPLFRRPMSLAFGEVVARGDYLAIDAQVRGDT
jgi:diphthine-ammonia ligase